MNVNKSHIVIVGAGFAGINLAKSLDARHFDVTIIDRNNYHTFIPLMYQVATGGLEAENIAYPLRRIFRSTPHITCRMTTVERVNIAGQTLSTTHGDIAYDQLVLATGSKVNYYNFAPQQQYFFTLKGVNDALRLRAAIIKRLEQAVLEKDPAKRAALLTFTIVGGGPTGLEMAGVLAEMRTMVLPKDYPQLDLSAMRIVLIEQGEELLPAMSDQASDKSLTYLTNLGVEIKLHTALQDYDGEVVELSDETTLASQSVIWAAGVQGAPIGGIPEDLIRKQNRLRVDDYCRLFGCQNVFAIGDVAAHFDDDSSAPLPMLAPVAIQQGQYLAKALNRHAQGRAVEPFAYFDKGIMATIGRGKAVADLPFVSISGFFAWAAWMVVHLFYLQGFRSKLSTLLNWANNYINYDRPLGLIIWPAKEDKNVNAYKTDH